MIRLTVKLYGLAFVLLAGCGCSSQAPATSTNEPTGDDAQNGGGGGGGSSLDATAQPQDSGNAGSHPQGTDATASASDGGTAVDASVAPRPSPGCSGASSATSATINLTYGGMSRAYDLHVPTTGGSGPLPLVINLHGYTGSSAQQEMLTAMSSLADSAGFFVAYPQGVGSPTDWNAGACCSAASEGDRDDVGFLNAVIDDIASKACVDLARVYSIGFSNGGMMTYRLACEDASRFAAAASVSGSAAVPLDTCTLAHPMPLMHIHGNADPLVPYDGGSGGLPLSGRPTPVFPAAADEVAAFRTKDGCPSASTVYFDNGNAHCDHWGPCQDGSEVVFCTIAQGGHAWPGGSGVFSETSTLDATQQIWTFLSRHALP
jgi:polyhydroxybutyrate depolymerase